MITLDILIDIHPKRINSLDEINDILLKIEDYEHKIDCEAGVAVIRNNQFGAVYEIISKDKIKEFSHKNPYEKIMDFYPHTYFNQLKEKFKY